MSSILIVEVDTALATYLCDQLAADDFTPSAVGTVEGARRAAAETVLALLLVGRPAEERGALALLAEVRAGRWPFDQWLPALVLTDTSDELEVLLAFRHGADEVMAKPAGYPELRTRSPRCCAAPSRTAAGSSSASATSTSTPARGASRWPAPRSS
jgi:DNA-binding response OmpR family regulator